METAEAPVFEYRYAKKIADRVYELLQPHCEVINIAGSISRGKLFVKDVEIVCIPKKVFIKNDLFGGGDHVVCPEFPKVINLMQESIVKGTPQGRYMQIVLKGGIKLDLFMPEPDDYYRQLTIRTGPSEFSHKIIANRWASLGWVGTSQGLRKKKDCIPKHDPAGKVISWTCKSLSAQKPPVWINEKDFFEWLGIHWVEPKHR